MTILEFRTAEYFAKKTDYALAVHHGCWAGFGDPLGSLAFGCLAAEVRNSAMPTRVVAGIGACASSTVVANIPKRPKEKRFIGLAWKGKERVVGIGAAALGQDELR